LDSDADDPVGKLSIVVAILRSLDSGPKDTQTLQTEVKAAAGPAFSQPLFNDPLSSLELAGQIQNTEQFWSLTKRAEREKPP